MNEMPGPTGVRIAGDEYQWLAVWRACLEMLRDERSSSPRRVIGVDVEAKAAGSFDDVVLVRADGIDTFVQVKYAVDAATPLNLSLLDQRGWLRAFVKTYRELAQSRADFEMRLMTNRELDASDPILSCRDGRDLRLAPRALQAIARLDAARATWKAAAECEEADVTGLLTALAVESSQTLTSLRREIRFGMYALGLRSDDDAVDQAVHWVHRRVVAGERSVTPRDVWGAVKNLDLIVGPPTTNISLSMVDHDPHSSRADVVINLLSRMEGANAFERVAPTPPDSWRTLETAIVDSCAAVPQGEVLITGFVRQATAFLVGAQFRAVRGYGLGFLQRGEIWSSSAPTPPIDLHVETRSVGAGTERAVVVEVSASGTDDVLTWLRRTEVPVAEIVSIRADAIGPSAIKDAASANAFAVSVRNVLRRLPWNESPLHLFLIGPAGLACLLGHHWNRLPPVKAYEHLRAGEHGEEYELAFEIEA